MFIPSNTGLLARVTGYDENGQPRYGDAVQARCSIVKIDALASKTSVRADSSASRGSADEITAAAVILFGPHNPPRIDDRFEIDGLQMKVQSCQPRHDVIGRIDHYQVTFEFWGDDDDNDLTGTEDDLWRNA